MIRLTASGFAPSRLWPPGTEGRPDTAIRADWNLVSAGYFDTLRIPIVRGRGVADTDRASTQRVVVVNEALAAQTWPGRNPIGESLMYYNGTTFEALTVVGVARTAKYRTLGESPQPFVYVPLAQHYHPEMWLMIRGSHRAVAIAQATIRTIDSNLPVLATQSLVDATAFILTAYRFAAWVAAIVGLVGISLAALGIYGITAYNVSQRTREIGVRIALGALRGQVVWLVVGGSLTLVVSGLAIGLALAALATRLLVSLLFGVQPLDVVSFGGGAALLILLATIASVVPARRASSVNPVTALRTE